MNSSDEWRFPEDVDPLVKPKIERFCKQRKNLEKIERLLSLLRKEQDELAKEIAPYRLSPMDSLPLSAQPSLIAVNSNYIDRLPNELLLLVFQSVIAPRGPHPNIRSLLLVCRQWHALIIDSPNLWTSIELYVTQAPLDEQVASIAAYISACVERSAGLLLDINLQLADFPNLSSFFHDYVYRFTSLFTNEPSHQALLYSLLDQDWLVDSSHYDQVSGEVLEIIFGTCTPYLNRCRALTIRLPNGTYIAHKVLVHLECATPHLTSLDISSFDDYWEDADDFGWFPDLSSLTSLRVGSYVPLRSLTFSDKRLRHLQISNDSTGNDLHRLSSFTNLRTLHIICHHRGIHPELSVYLPALVALTISGNLAQVQNMAFDLPSLEDLYLKVDENIEGLIIPALAPRRIVVEALVELKISLVLLPLLPLSKHTESIRLVNIDRFDVEETLQLWKETHNAKLRRTIKLIGNNGEEEVVEV